MAKTEEFTATKMLAFIYLHDLFQNNNRFNDFFQRRALRMKRHDITSHLAGSSLWRGHTHDFNEKKVGGVRRVQ
jgi:hypothetical protein